MLKSPCPPQDVEVVEDPREEEEVVVVDVNTVMTSTNKEEVGSKS